jgi:hypothetical protein
MPFDLLFYYSKGKGSGIDFLEASQPESFIQFHSEGAWQR